VRRGFGGVHVEGFRNERSNDSQGETSFLFGKRLMGAMIGSVRKGVAVLRAFSAASPELGVTQLSSALKLNKTVVHKLLRTFAAEGLVVQDATSRKYRLGPRIMEIASGFLRADRLTHEGSACLRALSAASRMTTTLGILDAGSILYIAAVEPSATVQARLLPGERCPLHASAMGKCLLAFLSPDERDALLARTRLVRLTPHTITSMAALRRDLSIVVRRGYALNSEERTIGLDSVAAPVWDYRGRVLATIGMAIPKGLVSKTGFERNIRLTVAAGRALTQHMGGRAPAGSEPRGRNRSRGIAV